MIYGLLIALIGLAIWLIWLRVSCPNCGGLSCGRSGCPLVWDDHSDWEPDENV
jgi:hypothetical protein